MRLFQIQYIYMYMYKIYVLFHICVLYMSFVFKSEIKMNINNNPNQKQVDQKYDNLNIFTVIFNFRQKLCFYSLREKSAFVNAFIFLINKALTEQLVKLEQTYRNVSALQYDPSKPSFNRLAQNQFNLIYLRINVF